MTTKVANDSIEEGLKTDDTALGVVFDNRALHPGMLSLVSGTEQVVCNLAIDDCAVVVVKLGLSRYVSTLRLLRLLGTMRLKNDLLCATCHQFHKES